MTWRKRVCWYASPTKSTLTICTQIMEDLPTTAVLVERVKDSEFQFLANAYSNHEMYAWAMGTDKTSTGLRIVETAQGRIWVGSRSRSSQPRRARRSS
jgi:3-polyprenyl-4-hydroxybenzoate decarboxylase